MAVISVKLSILVFGIVDSRCGLNPGGVRIFRLSALDVGGSYLLRKSRNTHIIFISKYELVADWLEEQLVTDEILIKQHSLRWTHCSVCLFPVCIVQTGN